MINFTFSDGRDVTHEIRKFPALLYIRAHFDELMKNETYRTVYYKLVDEFIREIAYATGEKPPIRFTDKDRESQGAALDFVIMTENKGKIEGYKDDAIYIVDWLSKLRSNE